MSLTAILTAIQALSKVEKLQLIGVVANELAEAESTLIAANGGNSICSPGQAFAAAGYRNGFRVEMLPDGADPLDVRYNMIHWAN